jgi:cytochrome c
MSEKYWKTRMPAAPVRQVARPTGRQIVVQLGVIGSGVVVWLGLFLIFVSAVGPLPVPTAVPDSDSTPVRRTVTPGATAQVAAALPANTPAGAPTIAPTGAPASTATAAAPTDANATDDPARTATAPAATSTLTAASTATPTLETSAAVTPTKGSTTAAAGEVSFSRDVLPIFEQVCLKCHGNGEKIEENLVLKTYADLMAGSDNGPVIFPGDPANSLLVQLITEGKMPKKGPRLLPAQIRTITQWVAEGARDN